MNKILRRMSLLMLLAVTAFTVQAVTFSSGYLKYETKNDGLYVTGLTSAGEGVSSLSLTIPGTVTYSGTTYRVWGIQTKAFKGKTNIDNVTIQWGTRIIADSAFMGCTGLRWVRLASSIAKIQINSFGGCTALKWVYYPGFDYPVLGIYATSWPSNSGMTLYIPHDSNRTPADYKSQTGWSKFATVTNSIEAHDYYMADGGYYSVGQSDTNPYTTVRAITLIGYNKNGNNTSNGTVYSAMGGGTFTPSGQSITFKVTTLGHEAFVGQTTLKTVTLPATMTSYRVGAQYAAFYDATSLTAINVASGCMIFSSYDGCLYDNSGKNLLRVPEGKTSISYKPTIEEIGYYAFRNCAMSSVRIPYGVKTIKNCAFGYTPRMDWLYIPSSVTSFAEDALWKTKSNIYLYLNMSTPPTCYPEAMFGITLSNARLYVPYNKVTAYKNAGWTGFSAYNIDGIQAHDIYTGDVGYTVTSTAATTVNGTSYAGRVKVVCYGGPANNSSTAITIPASVTNLGKTYAVTMIGEDAFNNHTDDFTVSGCANVDTVGVYAFQNQAITKYPFGHNSSRYIMGYAFEGAGFTGTVALPYGVITIGGHAFGNGKYSRIIFPASVGQHWGTAVTGTTTLTEFIWNQNWGRNYTGWDFTGVPSNCYIRVPTGLVGQWKQNSALSSRANYITAGAYDFAFNNAHSGGYYCTIISNSSTTYNGTTYAGKAKYVYNPIIQNSTSTGTYIFASNEEDRTVSGDYRKYLITEIGDSLLYGSKYTGGNIPASVTRIGQSAFRNCEYAVNNLKLPDGLTFVGHDAFYGSKITGEIKIPASVTQLDEWAFCTSTLGALYFPGAMPTMGTTVWSKNNSNFVAWVPNQYANTYLTKANGWGSEYGKKIAVWIKPYAATQMFSSVVPTNLSGSSINAYIASAYDKNNTGKEVTMTKVNQAPENTGMLLTDLTANQEYRIKRPTSTVSAPMTNYLVATPTASVNVYNQTVGYYWEYRTPSNLRFVKPTTGYNTTTGGAYLKLSSTEASGKTEVYTNLWPKQTGGVPGDWNGDGKVDITDVNAVINMMLGKEPYKAICDMDNSGKIDISDVNAVINKMLGK